jgi:integrase/recombinase XerD
MTVPSVGALVHAFFLDYLAVQKGLRPSSIKTYRDVLRLFLTFVATDRRRALSRLTMDDLTFDRVLRFLASLETDRHNHPRTRNHRRAVIVGFFEYLARRVPDHLVISQQVAAIPVKRVAPPETHFLEREDIAALFNRMPTKGPYARRDRVLVLFLYNTGARVQEVADLRVEHLDLSGPCVRLHGKGDKWRTCPLWPETITHLRQLLDSHPGPRDRPVFVSHLGRPLTRFGIYKIVRRLADARSNAAGTPRLHPHLFRHTSAVHLLEAGVDVNVIRAWLGHVSLDTTNRYAEINTRMKQAALQACQPPVAEAETRPPRAVWRDDAALLAWLASL